METKKVLFVALAMVLVGVGIDRLIGCKTSHCPTSCAAISDKASSVDAFALKTAMRELWAAHVIWTREYIVSAVANAPENKDVTDRLLRNQQDIGNAIVPYYGKEAGQKLADLLRDHILIAADVVAAAKVNDQEKLTAADTRWHDNAKDIAKFLSEANPNWPYQALVDMLNEHLKLTTEEAVAQIKSQWPESIAKFDAIFTQAMMMADDLSAGIIKQFPDKF